MLRLYLHHFKFGRKGTQYALPSMTVTHHPFPYQDASPRLGTLLPNLSSVTIDNVQGLLSAASLMQLHCVIEGCCDFLEKQLTPINAIGIRSFAGTVKTPQSLSPTHSR